MKNDYNDDESIAIVTAFGRDDTPTTPNGFTHRVPRGYVRKGNLVGAFDAVSGSYVGSDKPTPDPPDFACRRVRHSNFYPTVKGKKR